MGLPKDHAIDEGYARCRLCCEDVPIHNRGQSGWKAHWHSPKHYALEYRYRVRMQLPLYACNFQFKNPGKGKQLDLLDPATVHAAEVRPTLGCVFLEAGEQLTIPERQIRDGEVSPPLTVQGRLDRLWTAALIDGIVRGVDFVSVCRTLEMHSLSVSPRENGECYLPYTVDNVKVRLFVCFSKS